MVTIGLLGTGHGTGTTHAAISLATALKKKGFKTVVAERNTSGDFLRLGQELGLVEEDVSGGDFFTYKGVDYCISQKNSIASFRRENYEYAVFDFGCMDNTAGENLLYQVDYPVLVAGGREWNCARESLYELSEEFCGNLGEENVYFLFTVPSQRIKKDLKEFSMNVLFLEMEENPLETSVFSLDFLGEKAEKEKAGVFAVLTGSKRQLGDYLKSKELEKHNKELQETLKTKEEEIRTKEEENSAYAGKISAYQSELSKQEAELKQKSEDIERQKRHLQEQQEKHRQEKEKLEYDSTHDALTGCMNRIAFNRDIKLMTDFMFLTFDVSSVKYVNDTFGHSFGDTLITAVATLLREYFDKVYRVGGDDFHVLCDKARYNKEDLARIDAFLDNKTKESSDIIYQVAYGVADSSEGDVEKVIALADERMYEDKRKKKADILSTDQQILEKTQEKNRERLKEEQEKNRLLLEQEQEKNRERIEREREKLEQELSALQTERENALREQEQQIQSKEQELFALRQEKEEAFRRQEEELKKQAEELKAKEEALLRSLQLEKEAALKKQEEEIKAKEEELLLSLKREKEDALKRQEEEIRAQEEELKAQQEALLLQQESLRAQEEEVRQRDRLIKESKAVADENCIPNTTRENDEVRETETSKNMLTMWYGKKELQVESCGRYEEITFYFYPLNYVRPPYSCKTIVVAEYRGEYQAFCGEKYETQIGNTTYSMFGRFDKNGHLVMAIEVDEKTKILDSKLTMQEGIFTPEHFGKTFEIAEIGMTQIFPIKENINGTCDSVIYIDDEDIMISSGMERIGDKTYSFILGDKSFDIVSV